MKRIFLLSSAFMAGIFSACGSYQLEGEEGGEGQQQDCRMDLTLGNAGEFSSPYPVTVYLFDADNRCVFQHVAASETDMPVLVQAKGSYVLSLFSGLSSGEYSYPMETHPRQLLTFAKGGHAEVPLAVGKNHVLLERDTEVSVSLSYAVAGLYFSFGSFPSDVSEVTVHVSPVGSGISLAGDIADDRQFATVSCRKEGSCWVAGPVYVFPSDASRVHLSVKLRQGSTETVYGYDYNSSFKSGSIYRFVSGEKGGIILDGENQVTGWRPGVDIEFGFGDLVEEDADDWEEEPDEGGGDAGETEGDILYADELPEAETVWGPFYVWKAEPLSARSVRAVLLAPRQWVVTVDEARSVCEAYEVDDMPGWRVLTLEEAKEFRDQYSGTILDLSAFLYENGIDRFDKYDLRYLCNDFNSTFCFYNDRITSSGKTVDYGLRLVKEVVVEKR